MKNLLSKSGILVIAALLLAAVHSVSFADDVSAAGDKTIEISLPSIQCGMCVKTIKNTLSSLEGVIKTEIDLKEKTATVTFDESITDIEKIEGAINSAGYDTQDKPADPEAYNSLHECCKKPD
ncbi:MAG TPA: heavy-metal-associated domain-containing protein [Ignavibacteria bacterium]|nr:heavy-metal-associated domain-containing protein [Ignavibacteria bacterium]HMR40268.1 heavy-metal-associated domain-containing protein [Ignavibacteria bacterium]